MASETNVTCITRDYLDDVKNADYSNLSYFSYGPQVSSNKAFSEIVIKITLCLITIIASLVGNLFVLYTMFVLPKLRKALTQHSLHVSNLENLNQIPKKTTSTINLNLANQRLDVNKQGKNTSTSLKDTHNPLIKRSSYISTNQNLLFPAPTVSYKKTVNLFVLNLIICDLMIVIWCSWVISKV